MKIKNLLVVLAVLFFVLVSCNNDDDGGGGDDNFDHAGQAILDKETITNYLKTHYYIPPVGDEYFGKIDTILDTDNVTSLFEDPRLQPHTVRFNDIDYEMYGYEQEEGVQETYPTRLDSVIVRFQGVLLDKSEEFDRSDFFNWFTLYNSGGSIFGFREGMQFFSGGINNSTSGNPIDFKNTGKGFFIIPSGLAYRDIGITPDIEPNASLVFHVDMGFVVLADNDNDGIINFREDINEDGEAFDDDSDSDGIPDFIDTDDDGDGVLTRDENPDPNGDGNLADAQDTDGDGTPDYLDTDDDDDGKLTVDESKTNDADEDGTPDYLDPDTN